MEAEKVIKPKRKPSPSLLHQSSDTIRPLDASGSVSRADRFWAETRLLNDVVHGEIELPKELFKQIIDTPQFQRLRNVSQMGFTQHVYHCAITTRFPHCIGTAHLAEKWMTQIRARQPELEIQDKDIKLVTTAALIHDLGHPPYSHCFENWMNSIGHKWNHEDMSGKLFEHIVDENSLDWSTQDVRNVSTFISGGVVNRERAWESQIVSNEENGVDVDKFDYLERDAQHLGLKVDFKSGRLIENSRVIGSDITFQAKDAMNVFKLFDARYTLHKRAYQHKICHSVEHLIYDVLNASNERFRISDWAQDVKRYHLLTDSLFDLIRQDQDPSTLGARALLNRLDRRELYPMVGEFFVNSDNIEQLRKLNSSDIVSYQRTGTPMNLQLRPEELILHFSTANYGMGEKNPLSKVKFYSKRDCNTSFHIQKDDISPLLPNRFCDYIVRVFMRGDLAKLNTAQEALKRLCEKRRLRIKTF